MKNLRLSARNVLFTLAVAAAVVVLGSSLVLAAPGDSSAAPPGIGAPGYGPRPNTYTISCFPRVINVNGTCQIAFRVKRANGSPGRAGQRVCFLTNAPNRVRAADGNCSRTNSRGVARGTFIARQCGVALIIGFTRVGNGRGPGFALTTERIRCRR